jgi:predicted ATPase
VRSLQSEERLGEAELYRLTGELLLQVGDRRHPSEVFSTQETRTLPESPEACILRALGIARTQQAKSLELRAAISLGRLWQRQGKHTASQQLLTVIYGWFTEGFDTTDLQEAQTLLAELTGESPTSLPDALSSPSAHNRLPIYAS